MIMVTERVLIGFMADGDTKSGVEAAVSAASGSEIAADFARSLLARCRARLSAVAAGIMEIGARAVSGMWDSVGIWSGW